jgi:hypothetical protein
VSRRAEGPRAVIEREMRWRPAGIVRRARVEIIGAVPERPEHRARNDDAASEGDQPRAAQQMRLDRGQLFERQHAAERQGRVVLAEQPRERELLACGAGQKDDGFHGPIL